MRLVGLLSRFSVRHYGLLLGCLPWIKVEAPNLLRAEVQRAWKIYMMTGCNISIGSMLSVWMSLWMLVVSLGLGLCGLLLAETALADAHQFAGGPVPARGLVMGRGTARESAYSSIGWSQGS